MKNKPKPAKSTTAKFTDEELGAMKDRVFADNCFQFLSES